MRKFCWHDWSKWKLVTIHTNDRTSIGTLTTGKETDVRYNQRQCFKCSLVQNRNPWQV